MAIEHTTDQRVDDLIHHEANMLDVINKVNATHRTRSERSKAYHDLRVGISYERFSLASMKTIRRIRILRGHKPHF